MIVYQVDKQAHSGTAQQIKDLSGVLKEIVPSLEILQGLLNDHRQSVSTPSIDTFRYELQQTVSAAIKQCRTIASHSQQLCAVSDQAAKHLSAVDDHFATALKTQSQQVSEVAA